MTDYQFYGGGGFGGINKAQERKSVFVPVTESTATLAPIKLVRSIAPKVYKGVKRRTRKKIKLENIVHKKHKKNRKVLKKRKKSRKRKPTASKKKKFQNF